MNILRAKQEIIRTVQAYLAKDEDGQYLIPSVHQRPILLMGPPGIGKTAIMEQAASACGISLVSYTITHHTRQSAIGLPYLTKRQYGGKEMTITEYTMSEIIASVHDKIEETGLQEGILFIDEINWRFGNARADYAAIFAAQIFWQSSRARRMGHCRGRQSAGV